MMYEEMDEGIIVRETPGRALVVAEEDDKYADLHPGRRVRTAIAGRHRGCTKCGPEQQCTYTVDVLDAKDGAKHSGSCGVFLVPPQIAEEWLFSSTHGQWQVVTDTKASRLIMVAMDGNDHDNHISHMQNDISPLVSRFLPLDCRGTGKIEYMTQDNRIVSRRTLALIESTTTGAILVEDVAVEPKRSKRNKTSEVDLECYRRMTFQRNPNMTQSEALLVRRGPARNGKSRRSCLGEHVKENSATQKPKQAVFDDLHIDHSFLTNEYHEAMVAALVLIANSMEKWLDSQEKIKVMILGLGAGLFPMFVHNHIPVNNIQVVELDTMVAEVASNHFGFFEDDKMKLQIEDGLVAVKDVAAAAPLNFTCGAASTDCRLHVLIVDTDSKDPSNGLSCPAPEFLEDSFLRAASQALVDGGIMIVNLVASAQQYHTYSKTQLKLFFAEVYEVEVDKDVSRVLIAMVQQRRCNEMPNNMKDLAKLEEICARSSSWACVPNVPKFVRRMKRVN